MGVLAVAGGILLAIFILIVIGILALYGLAVYEEEKGRVVTYTIEEGNTIPGSQELLTTAMFKAENNYYLAKGCELTVKETFRKYDCPKEVERFNTR